MRGEWLSWADYLLVALASLFLGCAGIGNILVHHHPRSLVATSGAPTLRIDAPPPPPCPEAAERAGVPALAEPLAAKGLEILVDQAIAALERESERYEATYSARAATILHVRRCPDYVEEASATLTFVRKGENRGWMTVASDDVVAPAADDAFYFEAQLATANRGTALQIKPTKLRIAATKAKVAGLSPYPWHWPSDLVLGVWRWADSDIKKVDFNLKVSVEAIGVSEKKVVLQQVGPYSFPIGKHELKLGAPIVVLDESQLTDYASAYYALPLVDAAYGIPLNVTVSVEEANSLGDPLKEATEKAKANRGAWIEQLREELGLEEKQ